MVWPKKSDFEQLLNYIVRSLADNNMDENDESLSFQKWKLKHIWFPFLDSPATPRTRNNSKIECKVKDCLNEPLEDLECDLLNFGNPHLSVSFDSCILRYFLVLEETFPHQTDVDLNFKHFRNKWWSNVMNKTQWQHVHVCVLWIVVVY